MSDREDWKRIHGITDEQALDAIESMGHRLDAGTAEIASLRRDRDRAVELLRRVEWSGKSVARHWTFAACPSCGALARDGHHHEFCDLAALLAPSQPAPAPEPTRFFIGPYDWSNDAKYHNFEMWMEGDTVKATLDGKPVQVAEAEISRGTPDPWFISARIPIAEPAPAPAMEPHAPGGKP